MSFYPQTGNDYRFLRDTRARVTVQWAQGGQSRKQKSLVGWLLFAGRFTEDLLVWEGIRESRSAAAATETQFAEPGEALDAAGRPPGADLIARRSGGAQRPSWTRLEAGGPGGAQRTPRAGPVSGQLGGPQGPPSSARLPGGLALLLPVVRAWIGALYAGHFPGSAKVPSEQFLLLARHGLVALRGQGHGGQRHLEGRRGRRVELAGLGGTQLKVGGGMVAVLRQARRSAVHAEVAAGDLTHHLLLRNERQPLQLLLSATEPCTRQESFSINIISCFSK